MFHRMIFFFLILISYELNAWNPFRSDFTTSTTELSVRNEELSTISSLTVALYDDCCEQGSMYGSSNKAENCTIGSRNKNPATMSVPDYRVNGRILKCKNSFESCCISSLFTHACNEGFKMARSQKDCRDENNYRNYGKAYKEKLIECCTACEAGDDFASRTGNCSINTYLDPDYMNTFSRCCDERKKLIEMNPGHQWKKPSRVNTDLQVLPKINKPIEDRCKSRNHNHCHHNCTDPGPGMPIQCSCLPGFHLLSNRKTCEDNDECADGTGQCLSTHICVNLRGNFTCAFIGYKNPIYKAVNNAESESGLPRTVPVDMFGLCRAGYRRNDIDPSICEDIDECSEKSANCGSLYKCQNRWGDYVCRPVYSTSNRLPGTFDVCASGLTYVNGKCLDIDECSIGSHTCHLAREDCINTHGSFKCKAKNEQVTTTERSQESYMCRSDQIYDVIRRQCADKCNVGYYFDSKSNDCFDVNECNLNVCGYGLTCQNTLGSYRCHRDGCPSGQVSWQNQCIENNCSEDEIFDSESGLCIICSKGYRPNHDTNECDDIDECFESTHNCRPDEECLNVDGEFNCTCPRGYERSNLYKTCIDIDECTTGSAKCISNEICFNSPGSYSCECKPGFEKNRASGTCMDIDECTKKLNICQQTCINTPGSYYCGCQEGFTIDPSDRSKCMDIDECEGTPSANLIGFRVKNCQWKCENTNGSYTCSCPEGYFLDEDNKTCKDIDECERESCPERDVCLNTHGDFKCFNIECPPGYDRSDYLSNKCRRIFNCSPDDPYSCVNTPAQIRYDFLTFPSNLPIPMDGKLSIFEISGAEKDPNVLIDYDFDLDGVKTETHGIKKIEKSWLHMQSDKKKMALSTHVQIQGPQSFRITVTAKIREKKVLVATHIVYAEIHVSAYEF